jgi:phosphatidylserine/phosphatidylglycerophosphate/cardiolipin synthase-like enzyme
MLIDSFHTTTMLPWTCDHCSRGARRRYFTHNTLYTHRLCYRCGSRGREGIQPGMVLIIAEGSGGRWLVVAISAAARRRQAHVQCACNQSGSKPASSFVCSRDQEILTIATAPP